jgi:hypothetical protein
VRRLQLEGGLARQGTLAVEGMFVLWRKDAKGLQLEALPRWELQTMVPQVYWEPLPWLVEMASGAWGLLALDLAVHRLAYVMNDLERPKLS